ncbi:hypothetical protein RJ55_03163 [Drechmeria coniospora]|nr:hypothetical protein RJ55_03163 [Drechmeria coniospora]
MASIGSAARRTLPERSIRILVSPTPISFAERRSVLQVLEQHGRVEVFRMTPGYHSNYISVTKEAATARKLVASSPLTYNMVKPKNGTDTSMAGLFESDNDVDADRPPAVTSGQTSAMAHDDGPDDGPDGDADVDADVDAAAAHKKEEEVKQFTLEIFPAPEYNHGRAMYGSPLHDPWPDGYENDRSFMATTLRQSLPKTMAAKGLSHWLFELGSTAKNGKSKRLQSKGWLPSKAAAERP